MIEATQGHDEAAQSLLSTTTYHRTQHRPQPADFLHCLPPPWASCVTWQSLRQFSWIRHIKLLPATINCSYIYIYIYIVHTGTKGHSMDFLEWLEYPRDAPDQNMQLTKKAYLVNEYSIGKSEDDMDYSTTTMRSDLSHSAACFKWLSQTRIASSRVGLSTMTCRRSGLEAHRIHLSCEGGICVQ